MISLTQIYQTRTLSQSPSLFISGSGSWPKREGLLSPAARQIHRRNFPPVTGFIQRPKLLLIRRQSNPINLVPRAFPFKNGWGLFPPHPFFKGKALGTRLTRSRHMKCDLNRFDPNSIMIQLSCLFLAGCIPISFYRLYLNLNTKL